MNQGQDGSTAGLWETSSTSGPPYYHVQQHQHMNATAQQHSPHPHPTAPPLHMQPVQQHTPSTYPITQYAAGSTPSPSYSNIGAGYQPIRPAPTSQSPIPFPSATSTPPPPPLNPASPNIRSPSFVPSPSPASTTGAAPPMVAKSTPRRKIAPKASTPTTPVLTPPASVVTSPAGTVPSPSPTPSQLPTLLQKPAIPPSTLPQMTSLPPGSAGRLAGMHPQVVATTGIPPRTHARPALPTGPGGVPGFRPVAPTSSVSMEEAPVYQLKKSFLNLLRAGNTLLDAPSTGRNSNDFGCRLEEFEAVCDDIYLTTDAAKQVLAFTGLGQAPAPRDVETLFRHSQLFGQVQDAHHSFVTMLEDSMKKPTMEIGDAHRLNEDSSPTAEMGTPGTAVGAGTHSVSPAEGEGATDDEGGESEEKVDEAAALRTPHLIDSMTEIGTAGNSDGEEDLVESEENATAAATALGGEQLMEEEEPNPGCLLQTEDGGSEEAGGEEGMGMEQAQLSTEEPDGGSIIKKRKRDDSLEGSEQGDEADAGVGVDLEYNIEESSTTSDSDLQRELESELALQEEDSQDQFKLLTPSSNPTTSLNPSPTTSNRTVEHPGPAAQVPKSQRR